MAVWVHRLAGLTVATSSIIASAPFADAASIHTGGVSGSYYASFCPRLTEQLKASGYDYSCTASDGTVDNVSRVTDAPSDIGYGQRDVLALNARNSGGKNNFVEVRADDARECVFAVSRNKEISDFGTLSVQSEKLLFILPPKKSGSVATFEFLQKIDPSGLGRASSVSYASDTQQAIRRALGSDNTVALFVQFPDPANVHFKLIQELGGHIVPVIDQNLLNQEVGGQKVYFPQETQVANSSWLKSGSKVVTACTPMVVFTGIIQAQKTTQEEIEHSKMIAKVRAMPAGKLLPKQSLFARVIRGTRELSSVSAKKFIDISEKARAKARPLIDDAIDAAKPKTAQ